ncbi:MAG: hypothetical protein IPP31_12380 [Chitinophagaceae bacterium]|nr:hypothetical protein [Chitinophagaceae bacterium]
MKKVYFLFFLLISASSLVAQDLDDIRKLIILKQYAKGKDELDKFLSNPANATKAEAWYYKAFVSNAISREPSTTILQSEKLNKDAYAAIKKYKELDPKEKLTKEEENATIFNVYYGFYDLAVKTYNSKDFEQSYKQFGNVLDVHDYIFTNNLVGGKATKFTSLDTEVVFNMIVLGAELKKTDELVPLYKKLVDANLTEDKYLEAYESLVMYYKNTKNTAAFQEYLAKGKSKYPNDSFWESIDIEYSTDGLEKEPLFAKYEELTAKYTNSYMLFFNYGFELNKYVYSDEPKTGNIADLKAKIPGLFEKAIAIKSTVEANMLLSNFHYNNAYDISEEAKKITGNKPDDIKKRTERNNASKAEMNKAIAPAEEAVKLYAAMPKLKASDKINYKQAYEILATAYKMAGNAAKAAECEKKKGEVGN